MPTQVQLRRGTTAEHSSFTGAAGEVTVDTTKKTVVVHDGSTAGGIALAKENNATLTGSITLPGTSVFNSTGLGIGTSSPAAKLEVNGSFVTTADASGLTTFGRFSSGYAWSLIRPSSTATGIEFRTNAGDALYQLDQSSGANKHIWYTAANERMRLDASGNLGLGVTPSAWDTGNSVKAVQLPAGALWTYSTANIYFGSNNYWNGTNRIYSTTNTAGEYRITGNVHSWQQAASGTAGNAITFIQAMTLDASGNFLVAQTSQGPANSYSMCYGAGNTGGLDLSHLNGAASGTMYERYNYNATTIGSITQNGTTGVLYNITSDQRLKENIVDAPAASSLIDDIQVRSFDWKSDGSHQRYGFIAQELVAVAPEAVHQPSDPDEMMGVDYSKLVPMLVKEIQSLRQRVAQLEGA